VDLPGGRGGGGGGPMMLASPLTPGSPLTYTPQMPMEPIRSSEPSATTSNAEYTGVAAWPAQPKLVPVVFVWSHGGTHVEVEGSFDNWTQRHPLQRGGGKDFSIVRLLPPGVYQYKFIVDGEWRYDPNQKAMYDDMGNVNNVIEVQEYVPENLDGVSGFDPPPSPPSSYCNTPAAAEDYAKEPPAVPPHLQLTLLNVPPAADSQAMLPRPQHVILNHLYIQRGQNVNALVVGTTHRRARAPHARAHRPPLPFSLRCARRPSHWHAR
jgi:5'-AMP-activated protein kinase regulatory beta subunit